MSGENQLAGLKSEGLLFAAYLIYQGSAFL
jgi:hypothetical protein